MDRDKIRVLPLLSLSELSWYFILKDNPFTNSKHGFT